MPLIVLPHKELPHKERKYQSLRRLYQSLATVHAGHLQVLEQIERAGGRNSAGGQIRSEIVKTATKRLLPALSKIGFDQYKTKMRTKKYLKAAKIAGVIYGTHFPLLDGVQVFQPKDVRKEAARAMAAALEAALGERQRKTSKANSKSGSKKFKTLLEEFNAILRSDRHIKAYVGATEVAIARFTH